MALISFLLISYILLTACVIFIEAEQQVSFITFIFPKYVCKGTLIYSELLYNSKHTSKKYREKIYVISKQDFLTTLPTKVGAQQ